MKKLLAHTYTARIGLTLRVGSLVWAFLCLIPYAVIGAMIGETEWYVSFGMACITVYVGSIFIVQDVRRLN